ncbi:MAG: ATP-binding protein [Bacteroidales bacterium]
MATEDEKYIRDLIAEGEHQQQDFKFEISDARKIARTLVAFANTDGGRLLIGVKDNGKISGIKSEEEYYMIDGAASIYCKPEIPFISFHRVAEGKNILEVIIKPSEKKPHYARDEENRWLAYHRVNDQNFLAGYIQLQVWKREKRDRGTFIEYSENEKKVLGILRNEELTDIATLREKTAIRKKTLQQILINLVSLRAIAMEFLDENTFFRINEEE